MIRLALQDGKNYLFKENYLSNQNIINYSKRTFQLPRLIN